MKLQLDKNRIVIRERSFLELLDLSVRVTGAHAKPLFVALASGIVPMMVLNGWLLHGLREQDLEAGVPLAHMGLMLALIFLEIPLATAPTTLLLGQVAFTDRPAASLIWRQFFGSLGQLLAYWVILRLVTTLVSVFAGWRYLNEVILLERNPIQRRTRAETSTWRRCLDLHRGEVGELIVHRVFSFMLGSLLFISLWVSIGLLRGLLFVPRFDVIETIGPLNLDRELFTFYFPLAVWLVVGFFTVVRFLSYLDLRIRHEGWEVELALRAQAAKLTKQLT